jgi:hypothetical protein
MKTSLAAALAAGLLLATVAEAAPAEIAAPNGAKLLLAATAEGVQIYTCESGGQGYAWVFKAPEAALFDGDGSQIMSHFAGPSWKAEGRHDAGRRGHGQGRCAPARRHPMAPAPGQEPRGLRAARQDRLHPPHRHHGRHAARRRLRRRPCRPGGAHALFCRLRVLRGGRVGGAGGVARIDAGASFDAGDRGCQ